MHDMTDAGHDKHTTRKCTTQQMDDTMKRRGRHDNTPLMRLNTTMNVHHDAKTLSIQDDSKLIASICGRFELLDVPHPVCCEIVT